MRRRAPAHLAPPVAELQPHQNATFNSAEVDLPKDARRVHLDFGKTPL